MSCEEDYKISVSLFQKRPSALILTLNGISTIVNAILVDEVNTLLLDTSSAGDEYNESVRWLEENLNYVHSLLLDIDVIPNDLGMQIIEYQYETE